MSISWRTDPDWHAFASRNRLVLAVLVFFMAARTGYTAEESIPRLARNCVAGACTSAQGSRNAHTPLHCAAALNDMAGAKRLLEQGAAVNATDSGYRTPLHWAAQYRQLDMIKLLLARGADLDATDKNGRTPLFYTHTPAVIRLLLDNGANANARNDLGNTVLHDSAFYPTAVDVLLEHGADVSLTNHQGLSALDMASVAGRISTVSLMIRKGADISGPLQVAVGGGQADVARQLLASGADVNLRDERDNTLLHRALMARTASLDVIKLLLKHGADVLAVNKDGQTPLHFAVKNNGPYVEASTLLITAGVDVNALDGHGMTPLLRAVSRGGSHHSPSPTYPELVGLLLDSGADISRTYAGGRTALHHASGRRANFEIVRMLVEKGADVHARDDNGRTPLHAAASTTPLPRWAKLPTNAGELVEHGADVNARDNSGQTPLHVAAGAGSMRIVVLLLQQGADVNAADKNGRTPRNIAEERKRADIVEVLKKHGGT